MKIKELIEKLKAYSLESEVIISGDPEGNDYRTIDFVAHAANDDETFGYVVIYPTDDLIDL